MTCERSTMQLMGNGICKDKEHSSSHQHTTVTLGYQTKHQDIIKRVRGVYAQVRCHLLECHWERMFLSVFLEELSESVFIPFLVFINVILCVYDALNSLSLCKSCQGEKDEGEERTVREDVRNTHFLWWKKAGVGGRERKKERKRKTGEKIRDRNVFSTFPSHWSYVDHYLCHYWWYTEPYPVTWRNMKVKALTHT